MSGGSIIAVAAPHGPLRLGQRTFGRTHGNGREAPIPDLPAHAPDSRGSHLKRSYGRWGKLAHFIIRAYCVEIGGVFGKRLRDREQPGTRPQNGWKPVRAVSAGAVFSDCGGAKLPEPKRNEVPAGTDGSWTLRWSKPDCNP